MVRERKSVCLISRQRIAGRTNGSSVYVLSIVDYLKAKGFRVHYLSPSPATFGRWPVIRLRSEMDVFDSIRIRGSLKIGRFLVVLDPKVVWRAALALLGRGKPAAYAIAVPLEAEDAAFIARHAPALADVILLDYAFLTPTIPHVGRPEAPSIVIMHDLFSARAAQFGKLGSRDSVAVISEAEEMRLLGQADLVLAIQEEEASLVRARLPGHPVAIVPFAVQPAERAFPGEADQLLFVGSKTAPNIDGLRWFIEEVWPTVRAVRPSARLAVAGTVAQSYAPAVEGVEYLGLVADLGPLYRRAGVVISPLLAGSGLKIKLIEAMAWGKAIVATTTTTQGVHALVEGGISVADKAADFAAAILALMVDEKRRAAQAERALDIAAAQFGPEACYRPILDFITGSPVAAPTPVSSLR